VSQGETWKIESVREVVSIRGTILAAKSDARRAIELEARLLPREREISMTETLSWRWLR
jgi:hypothetical protein